MSNISIAYEALLRTMEETDSRGTKLELASIIADLQEIEEDIEDTDPTGSRSMQDLLLGFSIAAITCILVPKLVQNVINKRICPYTPVHVCRRRAVSPSSASTTSDTLTPPARE